MSKVIGTGETVTDFIIRGDKPEKMVCGGSCYNSMISLGRAGVDSVFIGEVGDDRLGRRTIAFLQDNGVNAGYVALRSGHQSQLSLAFLNEKNDAEYVFYKDHASDRFPTRLPQVERGDVVLYGSFFAINPIIHDPLSAFINSAHRAGALVYYDINFRSAHTRDKDKVLPFILQNIAEADIVRGSDEDLQNVFGTQTPEDAWRAVGDKCNILIVTRGGDGVSVFTRSGRRDYAVRHTHVVSTVGAGDSFNAGFVYSLVNSIKNHEANPSIKNHKTDPAGNAGILLRDIDAHIDTALGFAAEVCASTDNYISLSTGQNLKNRNN